MNREDSVIIFKDKERELRCKLCVSPSNYNHGAYFCRDRYFNLNCVGYHESETIKGKCFDNSIDEIILTENICKLCSVCNGIDNCSYDIKKYIFNYMKHVREGKVKYEYERRINKRT